MGVEESQFVDISFITRRQIVGVGDTVRGGVYDNTSVPITVSSIDSNGVSLGDFGRIDFGRQEIIGECVLQTVVSAEANSDGRAIVTVTYVDPGSCYYETKRTSGSLIRAGTPAQAIQPEGPL